MYHGYKTIAFVSTVAVNDKLGYLQDEISGLNVRPYNYLLPRVEVTFREVDTDCDDMTVPFAVLLWDDGLDYDADGNSYFDDYPGDFMHSAHRTLEGAQKEAAWLEHLGVNPVKIRIEADHHCYRYQLRTEELRRLATGD
jgi:hypothetical protein